ncbi:CapA family protein [Chlorobium phaeovibrioides]|uniref:CapA family protein n=1 Tax=Chlorobium phaeovibrioides TaxID=1094 RepID=UPI001230E4E3|nr:CapA family protein [Chlorobium phaeovibrioides]QEQ57218.1 hypothetical protein FNV82_06275 [Chlorobium phaeovibrioides]
MIKPEIIFCGDSFLMTKKKDDSPFAYVWSYFVEKYACINLETSLEAGAIKLKNVCLAQPAEVFNGIDREIGIFTFVNNHISDGGDPHKLVDILESNGKIVIGPDNPSIKRAFFKGYTVDFISAYFTLPRYRVSYQGRLSNQIETLIATSNADHRIVNLHWGYEHTVIPAPFQRKLACRFVDAGADLLIGHHPHVAQGYERYKDVDVYYSLGNFNFWQFDRQPSEENLWGYMVQYNLHDKTSFPIPIRINENYQPVPVTDDEQGLYLEKLEILSEALQKVTQASWFLNQYSHWYKSELAVWQEMLRVNPSPSFFLKYLAWLNMPMQWLYRYSSIVSHLKS